MPRYTVHFKEDVTMMVSLVYEAESEAAALEMARNGIAGEDEDREEIGDPSNARDFEVQAKDDYGDDDCDDDDDCDWEEDSWS